MKKIIFILSIITCLNAQAQFSATILQTLDTPYLSISHIGISDHLAALRQDALDIRMAGTADLGLLMQSVSLTGTTVSSRMELVGNFAYVIDYNLRAIDLTDPMTPVTGANLVLPSFMVSCSHRGNLLYIAASNSKCYIYSLVDPALPVLTDSVAFPISEMKNYNDKLFTSTSASNKIYEWSLTVTSPYMSLYDSITLPATFHSMDVSGSQLLVKTIDTLYRYRISTSTGPALLSAELMPSYPFNGTIVARDTNVLGYVRYNTFYVSAGLPGSSFTDSAQILVDGNYTITGGLLDNNLYYTNTSHTYLVGFGGGGAGVANTTLAAQISLFPNPAADVLNVSVDKTGNYSLVITGMNAVKMLQQSVSGQRCQVGITALPAGIYVVNIYDQQNRKVASRQFVKK